MKLNHNHIRHFMLNEYLVGIATKIIMIIIFIF
jgi:hypothetical protein